MDLSCQIAVELHRTPCHVSQESDTAQATTYTWQTYGVALSQAAALATALKATLQLPQRACIGILAPNCPEWLLADFACTFNDFLSVGMHVHGVDSGQADFLTLCTNSVYTIGPPDRCLWADDLGK